MMLSSGDIQELMIDNARGHSDPYIYIWKTEITFIAGNMMLQVAFTVVSKKKKKKLHSVCGREMLRFDLIK